MNNVDQELWTNEEFYSPFGPNFLRLKINEDITLKIQKDALVIHESIGCRHYSRVDFIFDKKGQHHFLEINSLPGMTSTSLLPMAAKDAGVEFNQLIDLILNMALVNND